MLGKCFFVLCAAAVICSLFTGNITQLSNAVIDGAAASVDLTITLAGNMCLWCGIMEVLRKAGAIEKLSKILSPILKRVFPNAWKNGCAKEEITAAISANMLGIGNAATPFALEAMNKLQEQNPNKSTATPDMITLAVLGTSSVNLLPTTLIALRRSAGSAFPFSIIIPIWLCSAMCAIFGVILSRASAAIDNHNNFRQRQKKVHS